MDVQLDFFILLTVNQQKQEETYKLINYCLILSLL